jgi:hypothetical protein
MIGKLVYDPDKECLAIASRNSVHRLHRGDTIEVEREIITDTVKTIWINSRVEYANGWFLADMYKPGEIPNNLTVRCCRDANNGGRNHD